MKALVFSGLLLVAAFSASAASNVTVVIDGATYSCNTSGGSSARSCSSHSPWTCQGKSDGSVCNSSTNKVGICVAKWRDGQWDCDCLEK